MLDPGHVSGHAKKGVHVLCATGLGTSWTELGNQALLCDCVSPSSCQGLRYWVR